MTESSVAYCDLASSMETGTALGCQINKDLNGQTADVVIVFASAQYNYQDLLQGLEAACQPKVIVGCSSAGEFISGKQGVHAASAIALRSHDMQFTASMAYDLRGQRDQAARQLAGPFRGRADSNYPYRYILLLTDALAGHTDDLIEQLTLATGGSYEMFGGGAGDDGHFSQTHVFYGCEAVTDAAVALEILSHKPLGIGVRHGWQSAGNPMRVTEADGMKLISLNSILAVEVFEAYAQETKQPFDRNNPGPFFLHNALGIQTDDGYKLRVPLSVEADGSILCAADIPTGVTVSLMSTNNHSAINAAASAAQAALKSMEGCRPHAMLFFDCVATRLRMGNAFGFELKALEESVTASVKYVGCNTYGQVARVVGQFSGFHNCTAVVCMFPE